MNWLSILRAISPKGNAAIMQATANALPGVLSEYGITTKLRQAHFLAQLAHESAGFKTATEYASGEAYEGRRDLGNTQPGDGKRYKGRGLIQLTGRHNYMQAGKAMGVDLVGNPTLAAQFPHALRIAGWYWHTRRLNMLADDDNITAITRKINGGLNGFEDRKRYFARANKALEAPQELPEAAPKTIATSKTANASIIAATAGTLAPITEAVTQAKEAADGVSAVLAAGPWVLLALIVIGAAVFIWYDRRKKMQEHGI
jgi:predicted chitinase